MKTIYNIWQTVVLSLAAFVGFIVGVVFWWALIVFLLVVAGVLATVFIPIEVAIKVGSVFIKEMEYK